MTGARYDEVAEWYDATLSGDSPFASMPRETALRLPGTPAGRLLDIGCGGGSHTSAFDAASFDAAVSLWTHTDVGDWPAAAREARRVVRPGGPFVYLGVHPCFVGPHSLFVEGRGVPQLHAGLYRQGGRYERAPGISPTGLRARVGATHLPLAELLQSFLDAGFRLEHVEEPGSRDYPIAIALRCR